jgi:hypothetical protein
MSLITRLQTFQQFTAHCFLFMFPNLSSSSPQARPWLPGSSPRSNRTSCSERKRGGQPGNSNAFKHGLYSSRTLYPPSVPTPAEKRDLIAALTSSLAENRHKLLDIVRITADGLPFDEMCAWLSAATKIVETRVMASSVLQEPGDWQEQLCSLVRDLPALLRRESNRRGIPAQPIFVPLELNNLHANLSQADFGWQSPCLTDAQWLLLQETFLNLHVELDSSRKYRPRKPLPSDRLLLEGILWKLACGLRWQDLRGKYPVRLCQDLYRALCHAGYMQSILEQLHWHLNVYGETTLAELVEQGFFEISGPRVLLSSSEDLTWEKYTALILLQQGFHVRRAIQREADLERRRRGNFYRLPAIRLSHLHDQPARPPSPPPSHPASTPLLDILQAKFGLTGARSPDPPRQMTAGLPIAPGLVSAQSPPLIFVESPCCFSFGP